VTGEEVIIKLELASTNQSTLKQEARVYIDMTGAVGFPFMLWFGTEGEYNVLVTSSLGPSLDWMLVFCKGKFSLKTILLLSDQVISHFEDLHTKGYICRGIAPENLHIGLGKFGAQVSIANLSHAQRYVVQEVHVPYSQRDSINEYSSINAHKGDVESYGNDLESWFYVMRRLCGGSLPREGYPELTLEKKSNMTPEELFHGFPAEFAESLKYIKSLPSGLLPDYKRLRTTFQDLFTRLSFKKDYYFDWRIYKDDPTNCTNRIVQYGEGELLAQFEISYMTTQEIEDEADSKQHSLCHDIKVEAKFCLEFLRGLSEAEEACEKLHKGQSPETKLTDEQSQALIAAHREVLNECCDIFFAAWHPCSPESLPRSTKIEEVPGRMWHRGIYSLFTLLRHHSVHHLQAFLRLAYSTVALIKERVPSNEDLPWAEVLGELARCILVVGDADVSKCWSGVPDGWYNKVSDEYPHIGRPQHHLGAIAEPEIIRQLFHYSKALISVTPFPNTWQSLMTLFERFLEGSELTSRGHSLVEATLVKAHGVLFKGGSIEEYKSLMAQFRSGLYDHTGRLKKGFSQQSSKIAFILCAAARDFGGSPTYDHQKTHVEDTQETRQLETHQTSPEQEGSHSAASRVQDEKYQASKAIIPKPISDMPKSTTDTMLAPSTFTDASYIILHAHLELGEAVSAACEGGEEVLPFMHVVLVYLHSLTFSPGKASHVWRCMPWDNISRFVNTLRKVVVESQSEAMEFPQQQTIAGQQLPEDFHLRGSSLAEGYFPSEFFNVLNPRTKDRMKEQPAYVVYRAKRIWYLAYKLATAKVSWTGYATLSAFVDHSQADRYLEYDSLKQVFRSISSGERNQT
jgi:casein kinase I homolog HRR25